MLRKRKNRRYNETNDEEGDGERKFNLAEQIKSPRFEPIKEKHLLELPGEAITLQLIQRNGFDKPILVTKPDGLDLRVPPKSFLVRDVRNYVGHQRIIDVMDVKTQKNIEMSMKDWCKYYESKNRDRLLNVISLEFSHTKLDELVDSPMIVKLLDWVDSVWPKFLKESQTESTNTIDKMKYPKVQKYCLMSVKGSYTDFHIDFGGTSVWYHILRGKKIFWMVPPTELNLQTFEEWTLSGMQQDVFFGDTVEECFRVELTAGNTFFIPSGWIHAVYTLEDSLVFGGNFLHSFGIENQLKVSRIEDATRVPVKFRYPFYTEILWYVVQHYVYCLTEKDHLQRPDLTVLQTVTEKPVSGTTKSSIEIEDETTESEHAESDNKTSKKKKSTPVKRKRGGKSAKGPPVKKTKDPPEDDESTDIDSANEEITKPIEKVSNTCRMTKNSLLRLQYEVDEQQTPPNKSPNKQEKSASPNKSSPKKMVAEVSPNTTQRQLSLADIQIAMAPLDSKLNGWTAASGQSTWSNPNAEAKEPNRIHITKYELNGLKALVKHLSKLSGAKKNLPNLIRNSRALLDDCKKLIVEHENDDPELAVTGKAITPELLHAKKPDVNELIGQFFKNCDDVEESNKKLEEIRESGSSFFKGTKKQSKSIQQTETPDEKKGGESSDANDSSSSKTSHNKETKCLSPNKKLSAIASAVTTPPPRPKSPPTRPISNNQYTSKTKTNQANLLLPGSFADLIAATSTEKKVFSKSGADVAASLYGMKDLGSNKHSSSKPNKAGKEKGKSVSNSQASSKSSLNKPTSAGSDVSSTSTSVSTITTTGAGAGLTKDTPKPNSPEPPKTTPQKRFINPSFRPQNKEKLIFASAPYVSPVNATDQLRPGNLYPWQTPTHQPSPSTYSPTLPSPRPTHSGQASSQSTSAHQQPPCAPDSRAQNQSRVVLMPNPKHSQTEQSDSKRLQSPQPGDRPQAEVSKLNIQQPVSNRDPSKVNVIVKAERQDTLKNEQSAASCSTKRPETTKTNATIVHPVESSDTTSVIKAPDALKPDEIQQKKPFKPRGPPKKSKEARQVIEMATPSVVQAPVPVSVIVQVQPSTSSGAQAQSAPKAKNKRPKKQSTPTESSKTATAPSPKSSVSATTTANVAGQQSKQSLVCGLVTPSNPTGAKVNPQQYLISRPLLFNTMPTFSTAQFHQMPHAQMPMFSTPMGSSLGLPLQQGARIVWATPSRFPNPLATTTTTTTTTAAGTSRPTVPVAQPRLAAVPPAAKAIASRLAPVPPQIDNAALLSLATTALSTAPMTSSPALSHLGNRPSPSQAIMVSAAPGQPTVFAGQQFFRPFFPRMPMTQLVTRPGAPRQPGQLVFASLPNQNQPRYLIAQPGFMQQRFQAAPHVVTSQPTSTLAFAAFKPPTNTPKAMKAKKVKTN